MYDLTEVDLQPGDLVMCQYLPGSPSNILGADDGIAPPRIARVVGIEPNHLVVAYDALNPDETVAHKVPRAFRPVEGTLRLATVHDILKEIELLCAGIRTGVSYVGTPSWDAGAAKDIARRAERCERLTNFWRRRGQKLTGQKLTRDT